MGPDPWGVPHSLYILEQVIGRNLGSFRLMGHNKIKKNKKNLKQRTTNTTGTTKVQDYGCRSTLVSNREGPMETLNYEK